MACRVGVVEQHAFFRQLVYCWRFIELAAVAPQVSLTKIINKKKDNIRFLLRMQLVAGNEQNHGTQGKHRYSLSDFHRLFQTPRSLALIEILAFFASQGLRF